MQTGRICVMLWGGSQMSEYDNGSATSPRYIYRGIKE